MARKSLSGGPPPPGYDPTRPNRIRELRDRQGLSYDRLGALVVPPVDGKTVERLEKGPHQGGMHLTVIWMYKLAAALGCKTFDLLPEQPDSVLPLADREMLDDYHGLAEPDRVVAKRFIASMSETDRPDAGNSSPPRAAKKGAVIISFRHKGPWPSSE
jgi:hypothetical protein